MSIKCITRYIKIITNQEKNGLDKVTEKAKEFVELVKWEKISFIQLKQAMIRL